jgi:uncharacterized membrane protein
MVLAFVLAVAGLTTPNPTIVGAERLFDRPDSHRRILRVTQNPFPWGSGLWALAHVIVTEDIAGILTFGSVAVPGLGGTGVLDERKGRRYPIEWARFALGEIGRWRLVLAVVLFGAAVAGHRWAFRVVPLPTRGML